MRVGIYNRWLPTLGGGERLTLDCARVLAEAGHSVELIAHQPLDMDLLRQRFALDVANVSLRYVPDSPANERVSTASADYDLFLNLSHGDLFPAQAKANALIVHFPLPLSAYAHGGTINHSASVIPPPSTISWLEGVYPPESDGQQHWMWTGRTARFELTRRWPLSAHVLAISAAAIWPTSVPPPQVRVLVNGVCVGERSDAWTTWSVALPQPIGKDQRCLVELEIEPWTLRAAGIAADDRERGLPLQHIALTSSRAETQIAHRFQRVPRLELQTTARSLKHVERALDSYERIAANSRFTQQWIERRWHRTSTVLYPAVDLGAIKPLPKRPIILSVGRFFAGAHNKKHLPMIESFRALCDAGFHGWEYHLVGGCDLQQPEQRAYLESVQGAAAGYPIMLHVNARSAELTRLYGEASIFWHATGYGEDEERDPDSFEHFGITTLEAMAGGCVPIVIAKAGQLETVVAEQSGLHWHTLDELQSYTLAVAGDPVLREQLARGATQRSQEFSLEMFRRRVHELFNLEN